MANPEHLELLKQGVEGWNRWRRENEGVRVDLRGADLKEAHLTRAILTGAHLTLAKLTIPTCPATAGMEAARARGCIAEVIALLAFPLLGAVL